MVKGTIPKFKCPECNGEQVAIYGGEHGETNLLDELDEARKIEHFGPNPYYHSFFSYFGYFACELCEYTDHADIFISNLGDQDSFFKNDKGDFEKGEGNEIEVEYSSDYKTPTTFVWSRINREFEILDTINFIRNAEHIPPPEVKLTELPYGIYEIRTAEGYCRIEALPFKNLDGIKDWNHACWYLKSMDHEFTKSVHEGDAGEQPQQDKDKLRRMIQEGKNLNVTAYELMYELENKLRWLIYSRLSDKFSEEHGKKWWDAVVSKNIREKTALRSKQYQDNPYIQVTIQHDIFYCDFFDLLEIINKEWSTFGDVLKPKRTFEGKFEMMQFIRNCIAHNRKLSNELFEELRKNVQDIYRALAKAEIYL